MMAWWKMALLVLGLAVVGWAVSMALMSLLARRPDTLGLHQGRLAPCPDKPNCVCSQEQRQEYAIAPLSFQGDPRAAWQRLLDVLDKLPRTRLVEQTDTYLHAECTSLLFRFVDDLECLLDTEAGVIHLRSASRVGYSDLGVNRARVEAIRQAFQQADK